MSFHRYKALSFADDGSLTPEERRVCAHLDKSATKRDLVMKTGLSVEELDEILAGLERRALAREAIGPASEAEPGGAELETLPEGVEPWSGEEMPVGSATPPPGSLRAALFASSDAQRTARPSFQDFGVIEGPSSEDTETRDAPGSELPSSDGAEDEEASADFEDAETEQAPPSSQPASAPAEHNYRQLYQARFRSLEPDARIARAKTARDPDLMALCYDPDPKVVAAILENGTFGLGHARALAEHHKNARGLEILARRLELLRDPQVQRRLLKNAQLPDGVLQKIVGGKPLRELYKHSIDRNVPDRTRSKLRGSLRKSFNRADPSERAELIVRTEGRVLSLLTGCTFDGRTTQILASRATYTTIFIQNLARFGATPPQLLAKLLRLPAVRRQPQLRAMLLRHQNMPSDVKRRY